MKCACRTTALTLLLTMDLQMVTANFYAVKEKAKNCQ